MLDPFDQFRRSLAAEFLCVLLPGRQLGADYLRKINSVITGCRYVFGDAQLCFGNGVEASDVGIIVGKQDAGWPLREAEKLFCRLVAAGRIVIRT